MVVGKRCCFLSGSLIFSRLGMVLHGNTKREQETIFSSMLQNEQQRSNSPSKKVRCLIHSFNSFGFFFIPSPKAKKPRCFNHSKKSLVKCVAGGDLEQFENLAPLKRKSFPSLPANIRTTFSRSGRQTRDFFSASNHGGRLENFIIFSSV